ncbi:MAG: hypothetical protein LBJ59_02755 [Zoogloeaceae bacterium]|jgi:RHS repeat-associated protein|nr:hypothetical protein [Zoogloeaceae bacterium]
MLPDRQTQAVRHAWNDRGNQIISVDPAGRETCYDYAQNGIDLTRVRQKSAAGYDTLAEISWNARHCPLTFKDAAGQVTELVWNEAGQLTSTADTQGGNKQEYRYDKQGRLAQIIDPQGKAQAQYSHDAAGNLVRETDSEGYTLKHQYDALNRRTKTTYPDGTTTEYTWDKLDLVQVKDRAGKTTRYKYDAAGQITEIRDALRAVKFGYDRAGRLTSLTDGRNNVTIWQYDLQGRVIGKTTPDGVKTRYEYDSAGRPTKRVDGAGQERIIAYGLDNQITGVSYAGASAGAEKARFVWDAYHPRIAAMQDGTGQTRYRYAPAGQPGALRLIGVESPNGGYQLKWDALSRVEGWRVGAAGEDYAFDALGRIAANRNSALGEFQYGYLGQTGQRTQTQLDGTPLAHRYAYEPNTGDRRLKEIHHPDAARDYAYATTVDGLITQQGETLQGKRRTWAYGYDDIGRLASAKRNDGQNYAYKLDAADNLDYIAAPEGIQTYTHGAGNQINQKAYHYDPNGNRIADEKHTYQWDAENRLIGIGYKANPQRKTQFKYDGGGRRIALIETDGSQRTQTRYTWCGNRICAAGNEKGQPVAYYFHEGAYRPAGKKKEYYAKDHLGSIRDVLDESGKSLARYDYDPYGKLIGNPKTPPEFGYAGMQYHAPSGLYLTKYRVYDPNTGRWLSRDPIGEAGGINLYGYVGGNPASFVDPLGLAGMYVYFEGYMVDTGQTIFGEKIELPLGHAGVVAIDDKTGAARYFDFGRYGGEYGNIRDFTINTAISFDANGMITQESSGELNIELSERFGKNTSPATLYNSNADANKIIEFALYRQAHISEYPYSLNPFGKNQFNTCLNFAWAAFQAGLK